MPPPVFWEKSLQVIENKGGEPEKERQERKRGCKRLKGLELEMEGRERYARFIRDNTRDGSTDRVGCQEEYCTGEVSVRTGC